nr:immunoglobulin heavy chain junction region [Macaca mulatta]MOW98423.1 immunoglobulin heavy chain junction region [Macaca mulatta]MOW98499.1 immunoglobulin heavy chain junction region [Macaca mulatta]MOW98850.1 immunoglobulin heavy chain junction region [Macaca mulatta]MOW98900.1 immunoglobulin heavy chain junction region [Macaca mulatta]
CAREVGEKFDSW